MRNNQKLNDLVDIISGCPFESSLFNQNGEGLPLIRVRDVNSGFAGLYYSGEYDDRFLINNGDLLIGLDGDFKCLQWTCGTALLNQRVCKIVPRTEKINKAYLTHFLPSALLEIHRNTNFTTVKHLSTKTINEIRIPTPTLINQLHIANILGQAENLIAQRKESIRLLDEFLKSTFLEMFGNPEINEKGFPFIELERLCKIIVDCPHSTPVKSKEVTNYPCIRTSELTNGYISWNSMQYLEESEYMKRIQRLVPQEGDIVYGREGTYGEAIRIPSGYKFSLGQRTMLFRPDLKKTNSTYLWAMVRSDFVYRQAKKKNSGSTVGHVNIKDIRQFRILNPHIALQSQFAQIVEKTEAIKTQYQQSLQELENLYGSLSQRAFKGELKAKEEEMMMAAEARENYKTRL